ncbi:lipocalin family protein [Luteimonas vadosa]|uniref:Outer membrane lipoprotein Blc n=1 Tax=Luteimonas vadosa TaxID=1165507 RepID=A0ABP9DUZ0_9GAMM
MTTSIARLPLTASFATAGLLLCLGLLGACATTAMPASVDETPVDLTRFMGRWHVIAHVPYFGEAGHVASSDTYTLQEDGGIEVLYRYRKGFDEPEETVASRATVKPGSGNRLWTTWFFHVVPTRFRILEVAPDYSWALVDYPGRDLAWVFAREPVMDKAQYRELESRMRGHGVNTDKLRRVPQVRGQVGMLGFADPRKP